MNIYKRFNNAKVFEPQNAKKNPPENCGYALRLFKLNNEDETLELKNPKNKHIEMRIPLISIIGLLISQTALNVVKGKRISTMKPNIDLNALIKPGYIPFSITLEDGSIDVISPSYHIYVTFEAAIDEILKNKRNISNILKLLN
jgi:hypothetical protein